MTLLIYKLYKFIKQINDIWIKQLSNAILLCSVIWMDVSEEIDVSVLYVWVSP